MPVGRRVAATLVVVLVALTSACSDDANPGTTDELAASTTAAAGPAVPAPEGIAGVVLERAQGRHHTAGEVEYHGKKPPSGGDHAAAAAPCGFYDQQVPDEFGVHALEHGAVWLAYAPPPATSPADIDKIKALVASHGYVLASPYADMNAPVVLVAWERRLEVQSVDDPRVVPFIETYAGGTTAPEKGIPC